ncbi:hypothetical protein KIW84_044485 [Lathyrus oleraceus]|uniref:TIM-barrel domain-containing protein n=1 Tax=Pisum sativum TaxID=3888 RepID=A0A9D4XIJ2_PEA|nr:hypothetical protein KIW84_044485 [Pisum sativum]
MKGGNVKVAYIDTEGTFQPDIIVAIAERFVLPVVKKLPVLAGVCAIDPFRRMDHFLKQMESTRFSGVQSFPIVLFDGDFSQNLEENGMDTTWKLRGSKRLINWGS